MAAGALNNMSQFEIYWALTVDINASSNIRQNFYMPPWEWRVALVSNAVPYLHTAQPMTLAEADQFINS